MVEAFLLVVFSVFVLITCFQISKKSILFGGIYFFLFIYSIFAQIGYGFYPELSELVKAYFGQEYFYRFYFFNFLSFVSFYTFFSLLFPYLKKRKKYNVVKDTSSFLPLLFIVYIFSVWGFLTLYLLSNFSIINYESAADENFQKSQGLSFALFMFLFKGLVPLALLLYCQVRVKIVFPSISFFKAYPLTGMFIITVALFVIIANKLGSRTDIVALFLGLVVFEFSIGYNYKKLLKFFSLTFFVLLFLLYLEKSRGQASSEFATLSGFQKFLIKDYFAPAHILYAAMGLSYIEPWQVLESNVANTLILLKYPLLQTPVTELINPGVATRSAGYAFYLFAEGYIFMGYSGFLYNGLMIVVGVSIWYIFKNSNNKYYGFLILALMSTQFANIARSQSSYMYKDLYMVFFPPLVIFYFASGLRPKFSK